MHQMQLLEFLHFDIHMKFGRCFMEQMECLFRNIYEGIGGFLFLKKK